MRNRKAHIAGFGLSFRLFILTFMCLVLLQPVAHANPKTIIAVGGWNTPIDASNLISGAGSNLTNTYQSVTNATTITIIGCSNSKDAWQVYVSSINTFWPNNFSLYVRRTGNGTGSDDTTIYGGVSFLAVNNYSTLFFSGNGDHSNIPIQYQLTNSSLQVSSNIYNTNLIFTIMDLKP